MQIIIMSFRKAITIQVSKINLRRYFTFLLTCDFTTGIDSEQSSFYLYCFNVHFNSLNVTHQLMH
jgi:hypothetical protein